MNASFFCQVFPIVKRTERDEKIRGLFPERDQKGNFTPGKAGS